MPRNTDVNIEYYCPKCGGVYNRQGWCDKCEMQLRNIELFDEDPLFPERDKE